MPRGIAIATRLTVALSATCAFFSCTLCISLIPDVARGPFGFGDTAPSAVLAILVEIVPARWFAFAAAPLVFWSVLTAVRAAPPSAMLVIVATGLLLLGCAVFVTGELLFLHGTYAVKPVSRSAITHGVSLLLVLVMVAFAVLDQVRLRRGRPGKGQEDVDA